LACSSCLICKRTHEIPELFNWEIKVEIYDQSISFLINSN
jgi:hypothetical protein